MWEAEGGRVNNTVQPETAQLTIHAGDTVNLLAKHAQEVIVAEDTFVFQSASMFPSHSLMTNAS